MAESNELPAKKVVIQLKDWGSREITVGTTILEMLGELSPKLKKEALAARLNGKIVDLNTPLQEDASVDILTFDDPEGAEVYRHTASHVLAQAVKRLYGNVRLGIGPPISNGFYYDFDFATPISPEDLEKIEEQVKQGNWVPSNCLTWRALTGVVTSATPCCSASMAQLFPEKKCWKNTCIYWRRRAKGTTVNLEENWISSAFTRRLPVFLFIILGE